MGSFFDIAGRVVIGLIKSDAASRIGRYALRQATAAVVRDIRRRTAISRRSKMSIS